MGDEPTAFAAIIGGMKCGTTSLFELLAQHPEVAPASEKEPDFFSSVANPADEWERYTALWSWNPDRHRIALEASTSYAKYPWVKDVPERIASTGRPFRFIYLVRDPVRRIASQVRHGLYDGWGRSLDEGLTDDLIDFSRYAAQLDRYTAIFPAEHVLVLTLEELQSDPDPVLRRTCEFLGLSPDHRFVGSEEPRNTGDFYQVPGPVAKLARNRAAKALVNHVLPSGARHRLRKALARMSAREPDAIGRYRLDEGEVRHVRSMLADDMARLRDHYGVRAPWLPAS